MGSCYYLFFIDESFIVENVCFVVRIVIFEVNLLGKFRRFCLFFIDDVRFFIDIVGNIFIIFFFLIILLNVKRFDFCEKF